LRLAAAHSWDVTPVEARALQASLRTRVEAHDRLDPLHRVAGVDVAFPRKGRARVARAAAAVLRFPSLEPVETATAVVPVSFPYVPGLLSFREIPAILPALERLSRLPDLLLCDGQGIAHPRRFGLACHLGVLLDRPTIGVAKTRLVGSHAAVPQARGAWTPLEHEGEVVGAVLRTREGVKPVYVSPGHRIDLETAVARVMDCVTRFRLPETTRAAHRAAGTG
jgi:deoxyribonuclease V